jgi:hypothetical protein
MMWRWRRWKFWSLESLESENPGIPEGCIFHHTFFSLMLRFVDDTFEPEIAATIGKYLHVVLTYFEILRCGLSSYAHEYWWKRGQARDMGKQKDRFVHMFSVRYSFYPMSRQW